MSQVITFEDYLPSPRYDALPWTSVKIYEGTASPGPWTLIDTKTITPTDPDPAQPAYRNFTTTLASDPFDLWYRLTFFDAAGAFAQPTFPVQNVEDERPVYASVGELAQLLKLRAADRHAGLLRVLKSASHEIDSEIGTADINGDSLPYGCAPAIVQSVCLDRAVEHWQQQFSPFGIIGLGELSSVYTARNSWDRHAHKLSVLKSSWGLA